MAGSTGIGTPVTGVAACNATDWATYANTKHCGLLHLFNPLSLAATMNNVTWYCRFLFLMVSIGRGSGTSID